MMHQQLYRCIWGIGYLWPTTWIVHYDFFIRMKEYSNKEFYDILQLEVNQQLNLERSGEHTVTRIENEEIKDD